MKAKEIIYILNPYEFLPSYGENEVQIEFKKRNLLLQINYDGESDIENSIIINFINVTYHNFSSFPFVEPMKVQYETYHKLSHLVEFLNSDLTKEWEKLFDNLNKYRHFKMLFLNANKKIEVVSEDIKIQYKQGE